MTSLRETHPSVFDYFIAGHHVVRRSNSAWAGLSSDLTIEQILMGGQVNWRADKREGYNRVSKFKVAAFDACVCGNEQSDARCNSYREEHE